MTEPRDVAFERSLALHRAVASTIAADPRVLPRARARVAAWQRDADVPARYADAWADILGASEREIAETIVEPSERMHELRQASPFAGALAPRTRWAILRQATKTTP